MTNNIFNPMEIDAIGEIMNISLGSSATAVSNLLDHRVDITTPRVSVVQAQDLELGDLKPAIGVEIQFVSGLEGSNIMLLKRSDIKAIVDILMGSETPEEEFELNELTISAVCEVMNQMMGAASTALSDFLGRMVNISTPQSFELDTFNDFKDERFPPSAGTYVVVRFMLSIENALESEFVNVFPASLARELIAGFGLDALGEDQPIVPIEEESGGPLSQEEVEKLLASVAPPAPAPPAESGASKSLSQEEIERLMSGGLSQEPDPAPSGGGTLSQAEIEALMQSSAVAPPPADLMPPQAPPAPGAFPPMDPAYMQANGAQPPYPYPPYPGYYYPPPGSAPPVQPAEPKMINTQAVDLPQMNLADKLGEEQAQNLDLIMSVPLEISVEIGRTRRKVQDILSFSKGSLVVLDRLAGDQVDLYVNGQCIAKGDVVVIDDNFGLRITEVLKPPEPTELLQL